MKDIKMHQADEKNGDMNFSRDGEVQFHKTVAYNHSK